MGDWISVQFIEIVDGEEVHAGSSTMPHAPRVGEHIWLAGGSTGLKEPERVPPYIVTDVCYWLGDHSRGYKPAYCAVAAYVEKV